MPFTLDQFISARPFLYHLTSRDNLASLIRERKMYCAAAILRQNSATEWIDKKRGDMLRLHLDGKFVDIRDQMPLHQGNTLLQGGWKFADLIRELNARVFFWPGWSDKPIAYGQRHYERYAADAPVIIRLSTADVFSKNSEPPMFCKYNSGSPRCTGGQGSPRGPTTFVECHQATYTVSKVVEVTFENEIVLPETIQTSNAVTGPWRNV